MRYFSTSGKVQVDQPTLIECVRFRGRERRINISQEIGTKYITFGTLLLEERTGERVNAIALKHRNDSEQTSMEILEEWIAGRGKHPINWSTLIEVLHDIELSTLAREIEAAKFSTDRPTEVNEDSNQETNSEICTRLTEDSDGSDNGEIPAELTENSDGIDNGEIPAELTENSDGSDNGEIPAELTENSDGSDNGEIPAELVEDFQHVDSEEMVSDSDRFTRYFETILQESEQKVERWKDSEPTGNSKASITTSDGCTGVTKDSNESDNGEIPDELIEAFQDDDSEEMVNVTDALTRYFETILHELEQRGNANRNDSEPTVVNKASIATSDICTRDTEDSDESNNGEIPAELIEDFRQLVDVIYMFTRYFETMLQESEQKVEKNCRSNENENHKVSDPTRVRGSDPTGDIKATNDICTRDTEDSDESDNGEIPAELIENFRHDNTEEIVDVIEDMQTRYSEKESEQKVERGSTDYEVSEPTGDTKVGMMELQFSRDPVASLIFEDTLDGDTETFKSDLPTCSGDSEKEQENQSNSVSCEIARNENCHIKEDLD